MNITPVLFNIRSLHNVGSIIRTAAAFGCQQVVCVGITPHLKQTNDTRLPHVIERATKGIKKTALGGERFVKNLHFKTISEALDFLNSDSLLSIAVEQDDKSTSIYEFKAQGNIALWFGPEDIGFSSAELKKFDQILEIQHNGEKSSLNVSAAAAIAIFELSNK